MKSRQLKLVYIFLILLFKVSHGVIWPCESDDNCSVNNSKCSTFGSCQCSSGYVFSSNFTECLTTSLYGEECEDSAQCNLMPSGAVCKQGICECDENYTYIQGRCRILSGLGEQCEDNIDCFFGYDRESVACKKGICECANNYYERYENICRRKSMAINDKCVVDSDCEEAETDAVCDNYLCVKNSSTERRSSHEIGVQTSFDEIELKPLISILKRTVNKEQLSKDEETGTLSNHSNLEEDVKRVGSSCQDNGKPCDGLFHSVCVENICYCQLGYYQKDGKCMAELGEKAEDSQHCEFEYENGVCVCVRNFFYERNLRQCKKPIKFNLSCTSNSQCSPFGTAHCDPVIPRRCKCSTTAEYNEKLQMCVYKEGLGAGCDSDVSCTVPNSLCSPENKVCVCKENYVEDNEICVKGIGADCEANGECYVENTVCEPQAGGSETKTCQCGKGYVHFKDECLKLAEDVGEDCIENEQCKPLLASCKEKKCSCGEKQHFNYGRCEEQKGLGDPCARAGECYLPATQNAVECRNSVCQCQIGYSADVEKNKCIRVAPKKNSSGRPSALKVITLLLIGSAFLITTAALKQAYY